MITAELTELADKINLAPEASEEATLQIIDDFLANIANPYISDYFFQWSILD